MGLNVFGAVGALPGGVRETSVRGRGRAAPASRPDPTPDPREALTHTHLQLLPSSFLFVSLLYSRTLAHTHLLLLRLPSRPTPAGLGRPCLTSSLPLLLSPVLSLLSLQLPADRVRQVRPVLRAPGPPSTSNQIPSIPRRPPFPSLPGRLSCDLTVAPSPKASPFHL